MPENRAGTDRTVVARVVRPLHVRGTLARSVVRSLDRRSKRSPMLRRAASSPRRRLPSRTGGRGEKLGLPLLLGARRDFHSLRFDARRATWTRLRLARVAAARGGRQAVAAQHHVRLGGRAKAARELELGWLPGYEGSAPVRIGNAAMRAVPARRVRRADGRDASGAPRRDWPPDENAGGSSGRSLDYLESVWHEPDNGIWEMRGPSATSPIRK